MRVLQDRQARHQPRRQRRAARPVGVARAETAARGTANRPHVKASPAGAWDQRSDQAAIAAGPVGHCPDVRSVACEPRPLPQADRITALRVEAICKKATCLTRFSGNRHDLPISKTRCTSGTSGLFTDDELHPLSREGAFVPVRRRRRHRGRTASTQPATSTLGFAIDSISKVFTLALVAELIKPTRSAKRSASARPACRSIPSWRSNCTTASRSPRW